MADPIGRVFEAPPLPTPCPRPPVPSAPTQATQTRARQFRPSNFDHFITFPPSPFHPLSPPPPQSPFNIQRLLLCPSTTNERSYVESLVTN